jgi:hypothetical protein
MTTLELTNNIGSPYGSDIDSISNPQGKVQKIDKQVVIAATRRMIMTPGTTPRVCITEGYHKRC